MSNITNTDAVVTESKLTEFYNDIKPFLGCPAYVTQEGDAEYYSTDEKVIGRWIDGKPLYQKVIYVDSITFNNTTEQNIDTSTLLDKTDIIVREFYGGYYCDLGTNTEQHHNFGYEKYINTEYYYSAYYRQADDIIRVRGTWGGINPWTIYRLLFVFKYTKKSDSAATTTEQKPTHYSTDEQVVGTWIDGKPIYQKTFINTLPTVTTAGTEVGKFVEVGASIDTVVDVSGMYKTTNGAFVPTYHCSGLSNNKLLAVRVTCNNNERSTVSERNAIWIGSTVPNYNGYPVYATVQYTKTTD